MNEEKDITKESFEMEEERKKSRHTRLIDYFFMFMWTLSILLLFISYILSR